MSDLQQRIVEVLGEHHVRDVKTCTCGWTVNNGSHVALEAHQAEMLAPIIRDAQREAWEEGLEAGWQATGEGFNSEYPGEDGEHPARDFLKTSNPYEKEETA